jgi:hypothetical protein
MAKHKAPNLTLFFLHFLCFGYGGFPPYALLCAAFRYRSIRRAFHVFSSGQGHSGGALRGGSPALGVGAYLQSK